MFGIPKTITKTIKFTGGTIDATEIFNDCNIKIICVTELTDEGHTYLDLTNDCSFDECNSTLTFLKDCDGKQLCICYYRIIF